MAGPGGRTSVRTQPRQAPIHSLLTAAEFPIVDPGERGTIESGPLAGQRAEGARWMNGIEYRRAPCEVAQAMPMGCDPSDDYLHANSKDVDPVDCDDEWVQTDPFLVWAGATGSAFGWEDKSYAARASEILAATEAYRVEHEFWTGEQAQAAIAAGVDYPGAGTTVPQWLASDHATVLGGGAVNPGKGLGLLHQALGDCAGGGPGMIHFPAKLLPAFEALSVITPIPASGATPSRLVDGRGNRMVPGLGYGAPGANTGPDGTPAGAGQAWMYATGLVYIYRDDTLVFPNTYAEALDRANNEITFRAERAYLVDWDRCCHFAVLVDDDVAID